MESVSKSQRQNSSSSENYLQPNYDDVRNLLNCHLDVIKIHNNSNFDIFLFLGKGV